MKKKCVILMLYCLLMSSSILAADKSVVLVANHQTNIEKLTPNDLKKVYLGLARKNGEVKIIPIRNHSDNVLHEVFLQHVIRMSSRYYERILTKMTLDSGVTRPKSFKSHNQLTKEIESNNNNITYMWSTQVENHPNLKVIQVIWRGESN